MNGYSQEDPTLASQSPRRGSDRNGIGRRPALFRDEPLGPIRTLEVKKMAIQLTCPKGHALTCPDDRAGKPAKCPKCGTKFVVPKDGTIVFLCPNGHKLNGPARLRGQPGQCPHCGARFRIPLSRDDEADDSQMDPNHENLMQEEDIPVGTFVEEGDDPDLEDLEAIEEFPEEDDPDTEEPLESILVAEAVPAIPGPESGGHQLAGIFSWLWDQKGDESVVELDLGAGETLAPDMFARELSQDKYAVFAVADGSGTYTVVSVPWDSVARVSMRKVVDLSDDLFE